MKNVALLACAAILGSSAYMVSLQTSQLNQQLSHPIIMHVPALNSSASMQKVLGAFTATPALAMVSANGAMQTKNSTVQPAPLCPMPLGSGNTSATGYIANSTASGQQSTSVPTSMTPPSCVQKCTSPIGSPPTTTTNAQNSTVATTTTAKTTATTDTANASTAPTSIVLFNPSGPCHATPTPFGTPVPITPSTSAITSIATMTTAPTLSDGSLLKGSGPTVYLVFGQQKYPISSVAAFDKLGLSFKNVQYVSNTTINAMPTASIQQ